VPKARVKIIFDITRLMSLLIVLATDLTAEPIGSLYEFIQSYKTQMKIHHIHATDK
jgi:hypothetical protein